jgi:hypothetical protein
MSQPDHIAPGGAGAGTDTAGPGNRPKRTRHQAGVLHRLPAGLFDLLLPDDRPKLLRDLEALLNSILSEPPPGSAYSEHDSRLVRRQIRRFEPRLIQPTVTSDSSGSLFIHAKVAVCGTKGALLGVTLRAWLTPKGFEVEEV